MTQYVVGPCCSERHILYKHFQQDDITISKIKQFYDGDAMVKVWLTTTLVG